MSSSDIAIRAENVSKIYRLGLKDEMQDNLGKTIFDFIKSPLKNYRKYRSLYNFDDIASDSGQNSDTNSSNIIWALRDVSLEVKRGEVVGIIGRNGAGKSTLLKILSRITSPTKGRIEIHGKIASLLEVGTGFHQELTGRENVYLNATVLGMRKKEVDKKFDEIVDFSGIEKFIDTPIKRYSSGMKVRLAFSVAAHLEPEILVVDEVLAVGDAAFQKKCLEKMEDIGTGGRTVLFVSHNLQAVTRLCPRGVLIENGGIIDDGPSDQVVSNYLSSESGTTAKREWDDLSDSPGGDIVRLRAVRVCSEDGNIADTIDIRKPIRLEMEYDVLTPGHVLLPNFNLFNEEGVHVLKTLDLDPEWRKRPRPNGVYVSTAWIPGNFLADGRFVVGAALVALEPQTFMQFNEPDVVAFQVIDSMEGDSARGDWAKRLKGVVRPMLKWETQYSRN